MAGHSNKQQTRKLMISHNLTHGLFRLLKLIVVRSISLSLENGYLASSISLGMGGLDLALKGFVIFLGVGVEVFDFEEVDLQDILIQSKLALDLRHYGGRTIE
jgi:hypothetical protein